MSGNLPHAASYRDPSGFIFVKDGRVYRQVDRSYEADYELLMRSGLYQKLTEAGLLIPHIEVQEPIGLSPSSYKILQPEQVAFISYPYEWSAAQLKDAALLTLQVLEIAMAHGMILKDASAFNIQFHNGRLIFIDTLSFARYDEAHPWIAYRQFCEQFLFPLYLTYYLQTDMQRCLSIYPDGIPVALTARLLPARSRFSLGTWLHVYLQERVSKGAAGKDNRSNKAVFNKKKLANLVRHLQSEIGRLSLKSQGPSTWSNYYRETILDQQYLQEKEKIFRAWMGAIDFRSALDVGANDGYFSRILAGTGKPVIAIDSDHQCIESLYLSKSHILPLCLDIANPSPAIGLLNKERDSFLQRVDADLVTALAIVHHLVLGRNIPLDAVAGLLAALTQQYLIVEFVPLADPKAQELIRNKSRYHEPYDETSFEDSCKQYFNIEKRSTVPGTKRILYQMKKI
jgi:hypothetical protein